MSDDRKDLPSANSPMFLDRAREVLSTYLGKRGDPLDRGVTLRDLTESGIVTLTPGYLTRPGGYRPIAGAGASTGSVYEPDLSPPPTPTGVSCGAGIDFISYLTDAPVFTQGHGYARTKVYGASRALSDSSLPIFSEAVPIDEFVGTVGSRPTDPATRWFLWLKWQTVDGVLSTIPAGGTNGFQVTTGQDVTKLLAILTGQITQSQLYADLGARIDLVDGGAGLAGSVNQRLASVAATSGNLLANSSFETQAVVAQPRPAGFGQYNNSGTSTTYLRPAGRTGGFAYGLRADATGATTFGLYTGGTDVVGGQSITGRLPGGWVASKTYVVSFWARKVNGAGWAGMNLVWNVAPSVTVSLLNPNLSGSYQRYAFLITWGASVEPDTGCLYITATAVGGTAINDEIHIDDLQVELGDTLTSYAPRTADSYAAIEIEATTRSGETSALFAQYTIKLDVGGYVSGFGLASSSTSSTFAIRADRFYVAAPSGVSGVADLVPFAVQATSYTAPNGEVLPAGVYMSAAYIRDLDVAMGRFSNAFITNAMIVSLAASRITAGSISVGAYIQSSTYVPGTSGWRIHGDGTAEFGAAAIRGQLVASQIDTTNLTIKDGAGTVIFGAGTALDYSRIIAASGWLNSNVSISSGGALSGAGGGTVTIGGLDSTVVRSANPITSANVTTYIGNAAINLLQVNTGSFATLSALSSYLGTVEIATGGYLRSGQTAWSTGNGFWLGWIGSGPGEPGFSIGSSAAYLRYRPSTGLELKLDTFTVTFDSGSFSTGYTGNGSHHIGVLTASPNGGVSPYTYSWQVLSGADTVSPSPDKFTASRGAVVSDNKFDLYINSAAAAGAQVTQYATQTCTITDANGRTASGSVTVTVLWNGGTP